MTIPSSAYQITVDSSGNLGTYDIASGAEISYFTSVGNLVISGSMSASSYNLTAGTGIGISGLTISNTGIISASAGAGISVSGTNPLTITNTGVTSFQGNTGAISLTAGTGIGISGLTVNNTGVLSVQGSTGAISLVAGTGISISGLTIANIGVTSLTAGTGITISGSTGAVTISASAPSFTGGNGITISGSTIEMSGSYSGNFDLSGSLTLPYGNVIGYGGAINLTGNTSGNVAEIYFQSSGNTNSDYGIIAYHDTMANYAFWGSSSENSVLEIAAGNDGRDGDSDIILLNPTAAVVIDGGNTNNPGAYNQNAANLIVLGEIYTGTSSSGSLTVRNTLDNGSGDMSVAGSLSVSSNINLTGTIETSTSNGTLIQGNVTGGSIYMDNYFNLHGSSEYGTWGFFNSSGDKILTINNISSPANSVYTYKNTLDDGSGNMSVAGNLSVGGTLPLVAGTGISLSNNNKTITNAGVQSFNGRTGAVVPNAGDYGFNDILFWESNPGSVSYITATSNSGTSSMNLTFRVGTSNGNVGGIMILVTSGSSPTFSAANGTLSTAIVNHSGDTYFCVFSITGQSYNYNTITIYTSSGSIISGFLLGSITQY